MAGVATARVIGIVQLGRDLWRRAGPCCGCQTARGLSTSDKPLLLTSAVQAPAR